MRLIRDTDSSFNSIHSLKSSSSRLSFHSVPDTFQKTYQARQLLQSFNATSCVLMLIDRLHTKQDTRYFVTTNLENSHSLLRMIKIMTVDQTREPSNVNSPPDSKDADHSNVFTMDTNSRSGNNLSGVILQAPYNPEINNSNNISLCNESTLPNNHDDGAIKTKPPPVNFNNAISIASGNSQSLPWKKKHSPPSHCEIQNTNGIVPTSVQNIGQSMSINDCDITPERDHGDNLSTSSKPGTVSSLVSPHPLSAYASSNANDDETIANDVMDFWRDSFYTQTFEDDYGKPLFHVCDSQNKTKIK